MKDTINFTVEVEPLVFINGIPYPIQEIQKTLNKDLIEMLNKPCESIEEIKPDGK